MSECGNNVSTLRLIIYGHWQKIDMWIDNNIGLTYLTNVANYRTNYLETPRRLWLQETTNVKAQQSLLTPEGTELAGICQLPSWSSHAKQTHLTSICRQSPMMKNHYAGVELATCNCAVVSQIGRQTGLIIIISPPQSTAGHRPLQSFAISLGLLLLLSLHLAWGRPTLRLPRRGLHFRIPNTSLHL
jgi:hypothetical protein